MDPMHMTPKLGVFWGDFLKLKMVFWSSCWALVKCTCLKRNYLSITLLQPPKWSKITSLEVFDVTSLWSCGTNCVWRAGNNFCYLDVFHCLFVYSNQDTSRSLAFINCQTQKRKTEESDLKTSAAIAVQPLFALRKDGVKWCQRRLCQTFCSFSLCFCYIASNFTIFVKPKESEKKKKFKHVWIMNFGLWLCLILRQNKLRRPHATNEDLLILYLLPTHLLGQF